MKTIGIERVWEDCMWSFHKALADGRLETAKAYLSYAKLQLEDFETRRPHPATKMCLEALK